MADFSDYSTVTITDYDCDETSATPESTSIPVKPSSPPEVTSAGPGESSTINVPPAAPTVSQPVPTTLISVGKPPVTPETPTLPTEHATSSVPGTGVEVTVSACPGCPSVAPSSPSVAPTSPAITPPSPGHPVETPSGGDQPSESPSSSGSSGIEVSVTVSACDGCPTASTSTDVVTETSSGQATSEVSSPEGTPTITTPSSGEHTPSATPIPNEASPLKGMHLAGLGLAALHLIM